MSTFMFWITIFPALILSRNCVNCQAQQLSGDSCRLPSLSNATFRQQNVTLPLNSSLSLGSGVDLKCLPGFTVSDGSDFSYCVQKDRWFPSLGQCKKIANVQQGLVGTKCGGFHCKNGGCIPQIFVCNGNDECGDRSDETSCARPGKCAGFTCANSKCLTNNFVCDNSDDCGDNSDESNCGAKKGTFCLGFTCNNRKCIRQAYVCDGDNDCGDRSDEQNCARQNADVRAGDNGRAAPSAVSKARFRMTTTTAGTTTTTMEITTTESETDEEETSDDSTPQVTTTTTTRTTTTAARKSTKTTTKASSGVSITTTKTWTTTTTTIGVTVKPRRGNCGVTNTQGLYGGVVAAPGEFPWIVKLYMKFPGSDSYYGCDAALISSQWVLTAAHCVKDEENGALVETILLYLGRYDLKSSDEDGEERTSTQVLVHPQYAPDSNWNYDFALIKMNQPVDRHPKIRPICLPDNLCDRDDTFTGAIDHCRKVIVAGWGKTETEDHPSTLRVAEMAMRDSAVCTNAYAFSMTSAQICAGDGMPSTCRGDSGGPLMCKANNTMHVIGVVSWGAENCGVKGAPSVFSRVCKVLPWILDTTKI